MSAAQHKLIGSTATSILRPINIDTCTYICIHMCIHVYVGHVLTSAEICWPLGIFVCARRTSYKLLPVSGCLSLRMGWLNDR